ncbi:hypothetical protein AX17_000181 [Amanita inopinata Kibby_2008]|nr:hypothetical protein AX17_000181 [Amanita inopinata Kibby_2008]
MAGNAMSTQHPPAVKVGGRRLSLSRHRPQNASLSQGRAQGSNSPVPDYPRPAAPGEEQAHPPHTGPEEEVPPKKEKKHNTHDNEQKMKELPQWKSEATRPTRDSVGGGKAFGAGGRIAQPAGKGFNA